MNRLKVKNHNSSKISPFIQVLIDFDLPNQIPLTSQEEKADKSRWAPACVSAPVASFCMDGKEYFHNLDLQVHVFINADLQDKTQLVPFLLQISDKYLLVKNKPNCSLNYPPAILERLLQSIPFQIRLGRFPFPVEHTEHKNILSSQ